MRKGEEQSEIRRTEQLEVRKRACSGM
jgi:hypothetical protein